ncbi:MAG TPA: biotin synthase BioB [Spirochaetota bacterium]|nr:biotin synthase BioB [Spirochaetota bacterium]HOM37663.1 biotin synthase BioB [Spirochaetota bacterium]HPQ49621.1 biotin synthase BioB [Spirochaetota bacterium]
MEIKFDLTDKINKDYIIELINKNDVFYLAHISYKIKKEFANSFHTCSISNSKSGVCDQNCSYCAQSSFHKTDIKTYNLLPKEEIYKEAEKAYLNDVRHFGIVTSGYGYPKPNKEFEKILETIRYIKERLNDLEVCCSLGVLSEETASMLVETGIVEYNHNLQVNPPKYKELIATTHSVEERINTIKILRKYPIRICSGAIIGLGETMEDRINLAFLLKDLNVDIVPINVLIPIKGTRLENQKPITAVDVIKTFCAYRIILKDKVIKFAAGRETIMKDFQGLILACAANGMLTGGYLTTRGRSVEEDKELIEQIFKF